MKVKREKRGKTHVFLRYSDGDVNFTIVFNVFIRFKGRPGELSHYLARNSFRTGRNPIMLRLLVFGIGRDRAGLIIMTMIPKYLSQ